MFIVRYAKEILKNLYPLIQRQNKPIIFVQDVAVLNDSAFYGYIYQQDVLI